VGGGVWGGGWRGGGVSLCFFVGCVWLLDCEFFLVLVGVGGVWLEFRLVVLVTEPGRLFGPRPNKGREGKTWL